MILSCEVKDSGAGIPSERMKAIFNSFEQLDSSHSRQHDGTGIGLALVQRLVEFVATALLTRLGFETDAVDNGQQALDRVRANHDNYEVILMDCHMPVMDGFEATRSIREWEVATGLRCTPIIALTADALPGTEATCHEAGMNDYLAKPVRKENLRTVLSRWLHL